MSEDWNWQDEERKIDERLAQRKEPNGFKSFADRIGSERKERMELAGRRMTFGVKFLDRALGGISARDLLLLGAQTSIGKTQLATIVAMANAVMGKRVYYFGLEAEPHEIERRAKYQLLAKRVYRNAVSRAAHDRMNFLDWMNGDLEDIVAPFEDEVNRELAQAFGTLFTFYRDRDFTVGDLEANARAVESQLDMLILDHIHYVDSDEPNENKALKQITKRIRDLALALSKPVICVAHVRKGDRKAKQLVPSIEDFHGSSDIPKIATKAVMLAPAPNDDDAPTHLLNTYMAIRKCRPDGSRTRYCGVVPFNIKTNLYDEEFTVGRLKHADEEWEQVDNSKLPHWGRP
jgi:replicative DNA helicase